MKRSFFTTVAIIAAFLAGVSLYVACGTSNYAEETSLTTLKAELDELKKELNELKGQVSEFEVDGLHFNRAGEVISKPFKEYDVDIDYTQIYYYDDSGRLLKSVSESEGRTDSQEYSYSGKKVTITDSDKGVQTIEYY